MRATIDGQPLKSAGTTLASALAAALDHAGDRMVIEAIADGAPVPSADLDEPPTRDPYAREISFATADPIELLRGALTEALHSIEELSSRQRDAGAMVQRGELSEALPSVKSVLERWQELRQMAGLIAPLRLGDEGVEHHERLEPMASALIDALGELKRALECQDWVGVGDVLAYELDDQAERWRRWLEERASALDSLG